VIVVALKEWTFGCFEHWAFWHWTFWEFWCLWHFAMVGGAL